MKPSGVAKQAARKKTRGASAAGVLTQLLPPSLLALAFVGVGVFHVTARVMVVDAGYRLSRLEVEQRRLLRENDTLKLELATLKSPGRLEKLAREELGMHAPGPGRVITPRPRKETRDRPPLAGIPSADTTLLANQRPVGAAHP